MRFLVLLFVLFTGLYSVSAQENALVSVKYNFVPQQLNSVGFNNSSIKVSVPIKSSKGILSNSLFYSNHKMNYSTKETMNTSYLECYNTFSYSLNYTNKINDSWNYSLFITPTISSNFESSILLDDVILNGGLVFTKTGEHSKLEIGVINNSNLGFSKPIPLLAYSNNINENLSFTIGFPYTKVAYKINSRNNLNWYASPKGFYANLSNSILLNTNEKVTKAKYQSVNTGLNFEHTIDENWKIALDAGYQISSKYELLNSSKSVYEFNTKNSLYVGLNLKFDLLNNKI